MDPSDAPTPPRNGSATNASPTPPTAKLARRRSQLTVMLGLFVTFAGLFGYALQVPSQPAKLVSIVPWLAVSFLTGWFGGILAGNSLVTPASGTRPALVGQSAVAGIATAAGALSAVVVALRIGPWAAPAPGTPVEWVIATVAAAIVWAGGFLMGHSMRRFVRRRKPAA